MKHQYSPVVYGLISKRKELARREFDLKDDLKQIAEQLEILDKAIKLFEPNFNLKSLGPKQRYRTNQHMPHGQMSTTVINILREAGQPMSTTEIAEALAKRAGLNYDDTKKSLRGSLIQCLRNLESQGIFCRAGTGKQNLVIWKVAGLD